MSALSYVHELSRILWVRALGIGLLAILAAIVTPFIGPLVPDYLAQVVDAEGVNRVLDSLAAALLTVTTFSVSVMVAIRNAATTRWTPRYLKLLARDPVTQNVLATFIGAYIFSLTAIILSNTETFSRGGYAVIFAMTIVTITLVIVAIIRWVDHLQEVGSLAATATHLSEFVQGYLHGKRGAPCWGANNIEKVAPPPQQGAVDIVVSQPGYIAQFRLKNLQKVAKQAGAEIVLTRQPGDYVRKDACIGYIVGNLSPEKVLSYVEIEIDRTFEQDVRFGLRTIADIAVKAMSPGINDPQTAVEIVVRLDALVPDFDVDEREPEDKPLYPNIWLAPVATLSLMEAAFEPILRYGGAHYEVQEALVKTLSHYRDSPSETIATSASALLRRAVHTAASDLDVPGDRQLLADFIRDNREPDSTAA